MPDYTNKLNKKELNSLSANNFNRYYQVQKNVYSKPKLDSMKTINPSEVEVVKKVDYIIPEVKKSLEGSDVEIDKQLYKLTGANPKSTAEFIIKSFKIDNLPEFLSDSRKKRNELSEELKSLLVENEDFNLKKLHLAISEEKLEMFELTDQFFSGSEVFNSLIN
jgi:hypothetical protein